MIGITEMPTLRAGEAQYLRIDVLALLPSFHSIPADRQPDPPSRCAPLTQAAIQRPNVQLPLTLPSRRLEI
jgi:hypothetical protein